MTRTKDWLQYSEELIKIADLLMDKGRFSWSCFTSQQAATAALKAILSKSGEPTIGDNLIALLRTVKENISIPVDVKDACHQVNDYFKTSRNLEHKPEGTPLSNYSLEESQKAKNDALMVIRFAYHESQ